MACCTRGEAASDRIIDDLLERLTCAMDLVLQQPNHVGIERQRGPHQGIMMPRTESVKMTNFTGSKSLVLGH
ncbi:hypothetical protein BH11MYX2_BH11MYX2_24700 [soil metagenome]